MNQFAQGGSRFGSGVEIEAGRLRHHATAGTTCRRNWPRRRPSLARRARGHAAPPPPPPEGMSMPMKIGIGRRRADRDRHHCGRAFAAEELELSDPNLSPKEREETGRNFFDTRERAASLATLFRRTRRRSHGRSKRKFDAALGLLLLNERATGSVPHPRDEQFNDKQRPM